MLTIDASLQAQEQNYKLLNVKILTCIPAMAPPNFFVTYVTE